MSTNIYDSYNLIITVQFFFSHHVYTHECNTALVAKFTTV